MKIIAGNCFGKNIQFVCKYCNCVYEIESKNDWEIHMVYPGISNYKVPEYHVICPNCEADTFLGYDPDDLIGTDAEHTICNWIPFLKTRKDWNERYRIEPTRE